MPWTQATNLSQHISQLTNLIQNRLLSYGKGDNSLLTWQNELENYKRINPHTTVEPNMIWKQNKDQLLYSYFRAKRTSDVTKVENPSKETEFTEKLNSADSTEFFIRKFKQYLVNQKVDQAFSQIERQMSQIERVSDFFSKLEETFRRMFEDGSLQIEFVRTSYEFYIKLSDGRQLTFDTLSEGFSALLSILMDLFTRIRSTRVNKSIKILSRAEKPSESVSNVNWRPSESLI